MHALFDSSRLQSFDFPANTTEMMADSNMIVFVSIILCITTLVISDEDELMKELVIDANKVAQLTTGNQVLKALNGSLFDSNQGKELNVTYGNETAIGYEKVNYTSSTLNDGAKSKFIDGDDCWAMASLALTVLACSFLIVLIFVYLFFACSRRFSKNKHSVVIENVPFPTLKPLPRKVR